MSLREELYISVNNYTRGQISPMQRRKLSDDLLTVIDKYCWLKDEDDLTGWYDKTKKQLSKKHDWYGQGLFDMYMDLLVERGYKPVKPVIEK